MKQLKNASKDTDDLDNEDDLDDMYSDFNGNILFLLTNFYSNLTHIIDLLT